MVPSASVFFEEVETAFRETAAALGLNGPAESHRVLPVATYAATDLQYRISLNPDEGSVECDVWLKTATVHLSAPLEDVALAVRSIEKRGTTSHSARNLRQMKNSLAEQAHCLQLVHPQIVDAPEDILADAGARRWHKEQPQ
ncbi:hypothetical protein AB0G73_36115 [Streptomyces sp. NPDC020719]|uniref:hypothetical protein n=1 Tax=Streptomyces sp. NPDC020719 TaxID=3154896 RepID=UPI0033EB612F